MTLQVIGAGFGRTGTESMKRALEELGYAPCYHMYEVLPYPERIEAWRAIVGGAPADWDEVFRGYRATVDWPAAHYWRELSAKWPEAKVLLTVRDPAGWYESMSKTILALIRGGLPEDSIGVRLIRDITFSGNVDDRDHVIATYERHNAEVRDAFGPDRLLVYEVGSGWDPLCDFLGLPVPASPFPRGNDADTFAKRFDLIQEEGAD